MLIAFGLVSVRAEASEPLRWGSDEQGGAPYVFQDPMQPNRNIGFEVELADLLAARLGTVPAAVHGPWGTLLELLVRGDFDYAINGIEVADEKKRLVALSHPYFSAPLVLSIRRDGANAPRSAQTLRGKVIGALPGSLSERMAVQLGAKVRTYDGGQNDLFDDLIAGRTDAVLVDEPIAHYYADLDPRLETLHGDFGLVQYAIAVRPDEPERLQALNLALDGLIADGSLRQLYERWGMWNRETATLFHLPVGDFSVPKAPQFEAWQQAVGKSPSFRERLFTRYPALLPVFVKGALTTLAVSLGAMLLAVALGVCLALGRRSRSALLRAVALAYIEFFRGTPLLIQLTMIYFGLPELGLRLDPFIAGVVALGLNYAAAEAENYRAGLESVPLGQLEAANVLGFSRWQTLRHIVGPQALRTALPPMTNDFIALLKDSSLISVVTLTELTKTYTNLAASTRDHLGLGVLVAVCYLLIGLPFARLARFAEAYFGRHLKREA